MNREKFLPIKIFEKRKDYDDRSTEGGGDNREPAWVLKGEALSTHVTQLRKEICDIRESFALRVKRQQAFPMLIATTVHEDALAKSHR